MSNTRPREAVTAFISENIDKIYRFAYLHTGNQHDAEDIAHESVAKALKSAGSLRDANAVKSWLYRIIVNTSYTYLKRQGRLSPIEDAEEETLSITDDYSDLNFNQIIEKLDEKYKTILALHYMEGFTLAEVSAITGVNENTVKTRMYRALKLLKHDMEVQHEP